MKLNEEQLLKKAVNDGKISSYFGKYRTIDQAKRFLDNPELYFSNYEKFNDPFEFSSILDCSCTPDEKRTFFRHIGVPDSRKFLNYAMLHDESVIKKAISEINKQMGVLCGVTKENNLLMWAHYANSHKGVFLSFDILKDPDVFFYPKKILYDNNFVHLDYIKEQLGDKKNILTPFFHKSEDWKYEEEIRIIDMKHQGAKKVKKDALVKIIFGCKASTSDIDDIKEMCKNNNFENVIFYKAEMNQQKYQLDIVQI